MHCLLPGSADYKNIIMTVHKKLTRVRRTIYDSS